MSSSLFSWKWFWLLGKEGVWRGHEDLDRGFPSQSTHPSNRSRAHLQGLRHRGRGRECERGWRGSEDPSCARVPVLVLTTLPSVQLFPRPFLEML